MRIQGLEKNQVSWMLRPLYGIMRRRFGKVLSPFKVWAYRPAITLGLAGLAQVVEHSRAVAPRTRNLASIRAAQLIGCSFCIDIGSAIAMRLGVAEETLAALDTYDENPLFSARRTRRDSIRRRNDANAGRSVRPTVRRTAPSFRRSSAGGPDRRDRARESARAVQLGFSDRERRAVPAAGESPCPNFASAD